MAAFVDLDEQSELRPFSRSIFTAFFAFFFFTSGMSLNCLCPLRSALSDDTPLYPRGRSTLCFLAGG